MTVDELATEIEKLSSTERDELYRRFDVVDRSKIRGAEIMIDDWQGKDKISPRATIVYANGTEETIDIIASVEANAVSIGHPVILCAIQRWEDTIIYSKALTLSTPYLPSRAEFVEIATRHLKNLVKAVLKGAKNRRISKELAVDLFVVKLGLQDDYVVLHKAWEWLGEEAIKGVRNQQQKIKKLEKQLRSDWTAGVFKDSIYIAIGKLHEQSCIKLPLRLSEMLRLQDEVELLQQKLVTLVLYEDMEHISQYLEFLKSKSNTEGCKAFPPPTRLIATKLIPEASQLLSKEGLVSGQPMWHEGDSFIFEFEDGSKASLKIAKALEILCVRPKLRRDISIAFGLTGCIANGEMAEVLNKSRSDVVCDFLRSKAGKCFLSKRNSWQVFANAFDAWRLPLANRSLQKYRSKSQQHVRWMLARGKEKDPNYWGIDIQNAMKFTGIEIPPHYHSLFSLTQKYDARVLLPAWFNEFSNFEFSDNNTLPVVTPYFKSVD